MSSGVGSHRDVSSTNGISSGAEASVRTATDALVRNGVESHAWIASTEGNPFSVEAVEVAVTIVWISSAPQAVRDMEAGVKSTADSLGQVAHSDSGVKCRAWSALLREFVAVDAEYPSLAL